MRVFHLETTRDTYGSVWMVTTYPPLDSQSLHSQTKKSNSNKCRQGQILPPEFLHTVPHNIHRGHLSSLYRMRNIAPCNGQFPAYQHMPNSISLLARDFMDQETDRDGFGQSLCGKDIPIEAWNFARNFAVGWIMQGSDSGSLLVLFM